MALEWERLRSAERAIEDLDRVRPHLLHAAPEQRAESLGTAIAAARDEMIERTEELSEAYWSLSRWQRVRQRYIGTLEKSAPAMMVGLVLLVLLIGVVYHALGGPPS